LPAKVLGKYRCAAWAPRGGGLLNARVAKELVERHRVAACFSPAVWCPGCRNGAAAG